MEQQDQIRKDENYIRKAIAEAQEAYKAGEIPVGAIVVCRDRIISRAHNLPETLCDVTAHAERVPPSFLSPKYMSLGHFIIH